jgi:hypothetical protein
MRTRRESVRFAVVSEGGAHEPLVPLLRRRAIKRRKRNEAEWKRQGSSTSVSTWNH